MRKLRGRTLAALATAAVVVGVAIAVPNPASARPAVAAVSVPVPAPVAAPVWAPRESAAVHPGIQTVTRGGGACTANFVVRGGDGSVYLGQAGHCAGTGRATETDGCSSATLPVGTPVDLKGDGGFAATGTLAYSSWVTMQQRREADPAVCAFNDFALVRLPPAAVAATNPTVPFFGGPTGVTTTGLPAGTQVFTYGNAPLRGGIRNLEPKAGVSDGDVGNGWGHTVFTVDPGVPGDSGSAFLDDAGRAVGVLSTLNLAPGPVSNGVADLAHALGYANLYGGLGELALVEGTAPFTPTPPGVPLTAVAPPAGPALGS
jgi:hypothetical protein